MVKEGKEREKKERPQFTSMLDTAYENLQSMGNFDRFTIVPKRNPKAVRVVKKEKENEKEKTKPMKRNNKKKKKKKEKRKAKEKSKEELAEEKDFRQRMVASGEKPMPSLSVNVLKRLPLVFDTDEDGDDQVVEFYYQGLQNKQVSTPRLYREYKLQAFQSLLYAGKRHKWIWQANPNRSL